MKILLTAFAFEPCESSEPGAAWRFARIAAREHQVYVLTGGFPGPVERTRQHLEAHPDLRITAIPFWPRGFPKAAGWKFINVHYWLWQRQLHRAAADVHSQVGIDIVHHVTLSRYWVGSSISKLPLPLIWGPVGSGGNTPGSFAAELPFRAWIPNKARELSATICKRDPLLRRTLSKAKLCFAMNKDTVDCLRQDGAVNVELLPQICFSEDRLNELSSVPPPAELPPINLLSIGRLVYWKGFQYGIRAAALLKERGIPFKYRIAGWGPYEGALREQIKHLGLDNEVELVGRKTNEQVIHEELRWAHLLIHPALHESFGNVCLEALAAGRPVICLDVGGPAMQVDPSCGFAIATTTTEAAIASIADAVRSLVESPSKLRHMSLAAKTRAREHFHNNRLENAILEAYRRYG